MARRRLIDPRVWQSGHFKRLNMRQRLLWIGIITSADDEGKLRGEPAVIKADIFPFDSVSLKTVESDLGVLADEGVIYKYEIEGDLYIWIQKWERYQKPSHPTPSKIPDPPEKRSRAIREALHSAYEVAPAQGSADQASEGSDRFVQ